MYGLYVGKKQLKTHPLKTRADAMHHVNDLRVLNPRAKIRIQRLR